MFGLFKKKENNKEILEILREEKAGLEQDLANERGVVDALRQEKLQLEEQKRKILAENEELKNTLLTITEALREQMPKLSEDEDEIFKTTKNNPDLIKAFEKGLNSSKASVCGACTVMNPKTRKTELKNFASRTQAQELLEKFKKDELILVA